MRCEPFRKPLPPSPPRSLSRCDAFRQPSNAFPSAVAVAAESDEEVAWYAAPDAIVDHLRELRPRAFDAEDDFEEDANGSRPRAATGASFDIDEGLRDSASFFDDASSDGGAADDAPSTKSAAQLPAVAPRLARKLSARLRPLSLSKLDTNLLAVKLGLPRLRADPSPRDPSPRDIKVEHSRGSRSLISPNEPVKQMHKTVSGLQHAVRKIRAIHRLQAAYRGFHTRRLVARSGIMNNLWVSASSVRVALKDVSAMHTGTGRLLLHVCLSLAFLMMIGLEGGGRAELSGIGPDPYYAHTSLFRRMKRAGGSGSGAYTAVESPNGVWPYLKGMVDEFYSEPLGALANASAAQAASGASSNTYLDCPLPSNTSLHLARAGDAGLTGRGYVDSSNRLLHSLLVVQQRHELGECEAGAEFENRPYSHEARRQCIGESNHGKQPFKVQGSETSFVWAAAPDAVDEEALEWSGYPAAFDLGLVGLGAAASKCKMDWFAQSGWIDDRRTKEVKAIVALYNANDGTLYSLAVVQWDFPIGGGREAALRIFTVSGRSFDLFSNALTPADFTQALALWAVYALYVLLLFVATFYFIRRVVTANKRAKQWRYALGRESERDGRRDGSRSPSGRTLRSPSSNNYSTSRSPSRSPANTGADSIGIRKQKSVQLSTISSPRKIAEDDAEEDAGGFNPHEVVAVRAVIGPSSTLASCSNTPRQKRKLVAKDSFQDTRISFDNRGAVDLSAAMVSNNRTALFTHEEEDSEGEGEDEKANDALACLRGAVRCSDRVRILVCSASSTRHRRRTRLFWLCIDVSLLLALHVVWIWWIYLYQMREELVNTAFANLRGLMVEPAASVFGVLERGGTQDEALAADVQGAAALVKADQGLIIIMINDMLYMRMCVLCSFFLVLRFFRLLQFHKRTALIGSLIALAGSELMHYAFVYIPVHFAMVWIATLLYGSVAAEFHTFWDSLHFLSLTFIGDPVIPESISSAHSLSPYLFFWTYFILTFFVLSNVLLSIIVNAYIALQATSEEQVR